LGAASYSELSAFGRTPDALNGFEIQLLITRSGHRSEPVPSEPDRLVANVDATLKQQVLDLTERKQMRIYSITVRRMISGELLK